MVAAAVRGDRRNAGCCSAAGLLGEAGGLAEGAGGALRACAAPVASACSVMVERAELLGSGRPLAARTSCPSRCSAGP